MSFQIGKTKVFLRAGQMAGLDARRTEVLANAARRIQRQIQTHLTRKEFIRQRRATIHMQKLWRGYPFPKKLLCCTNNIENKDEISSRAGKFSPRTINLPKKIDAFQMFRVAWQYLDGNLDFQR